LDIDSTVERWTTMVYGFFPVILGDIGKV